MKYRKLVLNPGIVGDWDGAYDWAYNAKPDDQDYALGEHPSAWPGESYTVVAIYDAGEIALLEAENDALKRENGRLQIKAKHIVHCVNMIRGTMQISRKHKDVFGGDVYLVDHSHMSALVGNTEELIALLADGGE